MRRAAVCCGCRGIFFGSFGGFLVIFWCFFCGFGDVIQLLRSEAVRVSGCSCTACADDEQERVYEACRWTTDSICYCAFSAHGISVVAVSGGEAVCVSE